MKIWHISDTHAKHDQLLVPNGVDTVVHSGDASNSRDLTRNSVEFYNFLDWFANLKIKNKVFVAGNHDLSIERRMITKGDLKSKGIQYIENELVEIDGLSFWGSPFTPTFGDWSFMMKRSKMKSVWDLIPSRVDVLVTHGPPKGVLDLTDDREGGGIIQVGCKSLMNKVLEARPKAHLFGHIHDSKLVKNAGVLRPSSERTIFSNGSCYKDGDSEQLYNNGNILDIN